jgi:hypothetical protein
MLGPPGLPEPESGEDTGAASGAAADVAPRRATAKAKMEVGCMMGFVCQRLGCFGRVESSKVYFDSNTA